MSILTQQRGVALMVIAATVVIMLPGCVSWSGLQQPAVSLSDLRFENVTAFETHAILTLRIENPNPDMLQLNGAAHELELNGIRVGQAMTGQALSVPRLGSITQEVPLHISNLGLLLNAINLMNATEFRYELNSTLYLQGGYGWRRLHSSRAGTIKLHANEVNKLQNFTAPAAMPGTNRP